MSKNKKNATKEETSEENIQLTGQSQLSGTIGRKYKLLVQILTSDPRYAKALADVTNPSQHEKLSIALTNLSYEIGASLSIIKALISLEFQRKINHPTTILRVNSIVSKMMSKYTQKVGNEYLRILLGDLVREIHSQPDLVLEPDPTRLQGEDVNKQAEENLKKLTEWCQKFVDRITSEAMIDLCPREIRSIAYFLEYTGELHKLNFETHTLPLISGFVMLRYIGPAITLPQNVGILEKIPSGNVRTNLTLITKVIQKLANGEKFEVETPHLMPMNQFLDKNRQKLWTYLKTLCKDPLKQEGRLPFGDLHKTVTFEDLHYKKFNMEDLIFIHGLIYEYGYELIVSLQNEVILTDDKRPVSIVSTETDFLALIHDLGPSPERRPTKTVEKKPTKKESKKGSIFGSGDNKNPTEKKKGEKRIRETFKGKSFQEIEKSLLSKSLENLMEHLDKFDLSDLEASRFLYIGKPTRNKVPTVYIILSRIQKQFLEASDKLLVFVYKTLFKKINEPYILVVDMSWMKISDEMQAALYRAIVSFVRLIKKDYLLNCKQVYLLHPTYKTLNAIDAILNLVEGGQNNKIFKLAYEWTDLADIIEPAKIWIPFVSKKFVPITFEVIKINKVEKKQERLLKITQDSILNIDNRSGTVHNEIMLANIQEIRSKAGANEIIIKFTPENEQEMQARGAGYFLKPHKSDQTQTRRYACFSEVQRDLIVDQIIDAGVLASALKLPQIFFVKKMDDKGKTNNRLLKFTVDSILDFKDKTIKREIPYATIQSFYIDPEKKDVLYINYMLKGQKKCYVIVYEDVETLRLALLDAVLRFRFYVETEKELFKRKDVDGILDRFFYEKRSTDFDKTKWKNIVRIDQPVKKLQRMFKRFNPQNDRAAMTLENVRQALAQEKIDMTDDEIGHLIKCLDPTNKGAISYEDLVRSWVFLRQMKVMIDKKKAASMKKKTKKKKKEEKA